MKITLKAGLHVAIVTSPKPGYGGSMLAWETYMVCKGAGIPAIVATFDQFRNYPPSMEDDLRRLPMSETPIATKEEVATCLISIAKEARDDGKFLILDSQAGFLPHDPMFTALLRAGIGNADSLTALVAIWSGVEKSRDPFAEIGIVFDRTFCRYWGLRSDLARAPSDEKIHHWIPRFLTASAVGNIKVTSTGTIIAVDCPTNTAQPNEASGYINEVREHLIDAAKHIYPAVLEPLIDLVPETPAADC